MRQGTVAYIAGRVGMALLGYLLAIITGVVCFFCMLFLLSFTQPDDTLWAMLGLGPFVALAFPFVLLVAMWLAAYFSLIPAIIAIAVSEYFGWRTPWAHMALAVTTAAAAALYLIPDWMAEASATRLLLALALLVAALAGGLAYWAVAGRRAGLWRQPAA